MPIDKDLEHRSYTIVPNECLKLGAMTLEAMGLWTYLLSLPDNTQITIKNINKHFSHCDKYIRKIMRELIKMGYVYTQREPFKSRLIYYVFDTAKTECEFEEYLKSLT